MYGEIVNHVLKFLYIAEIYLLMIVLMIFRTLSINRFSTVPTNVRTNILNSQFYMNLCS